MKVKEAARRMEVSPATVYALVASGRLRCSRIGIGRGTIRISDDQLADYLRGTEPVIKAATPAQAMPKLKHIRL